MIRSIALLFVTGAAFLVTSSAMAATYLDLRLIPDGSSDPPGDVLELEPGTRHAATVGPSGVRCAEAATSG